MNLPLDVKPEWIDALAKNIANRFPEKELVAYCNAKESKSLIGKYLDPVEYAHKVLGLKLTEKQEEILRKLNEPPYCVLARSGHSTGKCIEENELISLADGRVVPAKELSGRYFSVLAWDKDGNQVPTLAYGTDNGEKLVYKITTSTGRSIIRTGNHPLFVGDRGKIKGGEMKGRLCINSRGWTALDQIQPGDHVLLPKKWEGEGSRPYDEAHVKLLGYLLGDGGLSTNAVGFTQMDGKVKDEYISLVSDLGCDLRPNGPYTIYATCGVPFATGNNPLINLVKKWGIHRKKSIHKTFPDWAWELPNKQLALLLNRLFACDGWAYYQRRDNTHQARIGIGLSSEQMIRDVERAMLRLGISGRVREKVAKCNGKRFRAWEWVIYDKFNIRRFAKKVGIFGKEKQVQEAWDGAELISNKQRRKWRTRAVPTKGCFWDLVKSVELIGKKKTVCISVPKHHTFVTTFIEHNSFCSAIAVNWWFDSFYPSIVLTTAPTQLQVQQILWKEVRVQRANAGLPWYGGPKEACLYAAANHYAQGFTARDANSFQGRHEAYILIIFDEAQGIDADFWVAKEGMLDGIKWAFLAIYNPIGQGTRAYMEERSIEKGITDDDEIGHAYHPVIQLSCLEHPNIIAELKGEPPPFPSAVRLKGLKKRLKKWADKITKEQAGPNDIELDGQWWHPGPLADARILGRWPLQAVNTVWSRALLDAAKTRKLSKAGLLQIGCDIARYGDDFTAMHVRKGGVSLFHERHNGWDHPQIAKRLIELCGEYANKFRSERIDMKKVPVAIDETGGMGTGTVDIGRQQGFKFIGVNSSWSMESIEEEFPNIRSALWFGTRDLAADERLSLAELPNDIVVELEGQLLAQKYELDTNSRRCVWDKKKMKAEEGEHSPDDADAFNLAYLNINPVEERSSGSVEHQ